MCFITFKTGWRVENIADQTLNVYCRKSVKSGENEEAKQEVVATSNHSEAGDIN